MESLSPGARLSALESATESPTSLTFRVMADGQTAVIAAGVAMVRTLGSISTGDGLGRDYKRSGTAPAAGLGFQSADGAYWVQTDWIVAKDDLLPFIQALDPKAFPFRADRVGALTRTVVQVIQEGAFNVKDYGGGLGNAGVDATTAFNKAVSGGGNILVPAGAFDVSGVVATSARTRIVCDPQAEIRATHPTSDLFRFWGRNQDGCSIEGNGCRMFAPGARTAGWFISVGGPDTSDASYILHAHVSGVRFDSYFQGVDVGSAIFSKFDRLGFGDTFTETAQPGGAAIRVGVSGGRTSESSFTDCNAKQNDALGEPTFGFLFGWTDEIAISRCRALRMGGGLVVQPNGSAQASALIRVDQCNFDTNRHGIVLQPLGGSQILRVRITDTWIGGSTVQGVLVDGGTGGAVTDVEFSGCLLTANSVGYSITGAGCDQVRIKSGIVNFSAAEGVHVSNLASRVYVEGVVGSGNQVGLSLDSTATGYARSRNINGNTTDIVNSSAGFAVLST